MFYVVCVVAAIGIILLGGFLCFGIINQSDVRTFASELEVLRQVVAAVDVQESEDVLGKVADANMRIARMRRLDDMPIVGWYIPNSWRTLEPIAIPAR